jgi:ABC-type multidrug transport system permease subunit
VYWHSLILVAALAMLQGLAGMSYGMFLSSVFYDEVTAMQIMGGTYYPALLLSGVIWPIEGMPVVLRYISYCLPTTYAAEAMRSIMERGKVPILN